MESFSTGTAPRRTRRAPPRSETKILRERVGDADDAAADSQFTQGALSDILRRDRWNRHGGDTGKRDPGDSDRRGLCPRPCAGGSIAQRPFAPRLLLRHIWAASGPALCEPAHGLSNSALSKRNDAMGPAAGRLLRLR